MLISLLSQLLELRRYGTVLVSRPCDKHGRDTNFWKVQPLREYGHLLAKVSINIIFCSVSLYGLFLQGLVQFSSAESHFLLLYIYPGMKSTCDASCSDLGMFFIDRWLCLHWEDSVLLLHWHLATVLHCPAPTLECGCGILVTDLGSVSRVCGLGLCVWDVESL